MPVPDRSSTLGYATNRLDRLAEHREETARLAALQSDPRAVAYVLAGDTPLLRGPQGALQARFSLAEADEVGTARERAFLGLDGDVPVFAVLIDARSPDSDQGESDLAALDLRTLAVQGLLPPGVLGELAQAKSLMHWHQRHRFCSNCGTSTRARSAGWKRECAACGAEHFPRTDPVVIMLAAKGDRCVLGRQARFPPGMYSCLAGFIEPGETVEDAVRRELHEEAGLVTSRVRYLASQPWPFPASLMIGCLAEAVADDLVVDNKELEDARWFDREEVRAMLEGRHPEGLACPQPIAIAHHLMRAWASEGEAP